MYNLYCPIFNRKICVYLEGERTAGNPTDFKAVQIIHEPLAFIVKTINISNLTGIQKQSTRIFVPLE